MWPQLVVELSAMVGPVFRHDATCRSQASGPAATHEGRRISNTISDNPVDQKAGGKLGCWPVELTARARQIPECRSAGLQYDQKVNNKYSVGNGLSKRK